MDCDGCTLCCKLLNIEWMDSPAGEYCKECEPGKGCGIYHSRPEKCKEYHCAYSQMNKVSSDLRPDKCAIIFERLNDDIFIGTVEPGKRISLAAKGQLDSFFNQGFSIVLFNQRMKKPFILPVPGRSKKDIWNTVQKERKKLDGRSS